MLSKSSGSWLACAIGLVALTLACFALSACGKATVSDSSPRADVESATVVSSSELDERSQKVDVSIPFDQEISAAEDAVRDLDITLDGDALDTRTVTTTCTADGSVLHVVLTPGPQAKGIDSQLYFACYQGKLSVKPKADDGAWPSVQGKDGSAAVMEPLELTIPSGMQLEQVDSEPGQTTVRVTQFAQIRCCTWVQVGGSQIFMHHHAFFKESERTCAQALAEAVNNGLAGEYKATCEKDMVTVKGLGVNSRNRFRVSVVEGVGV